MRGVLDGLPVASTPPLMYDVPLCGCTTVLGETARENKCSMDLRILRRERRFHHDTPF
jgi:hypothetical protein